MAEYVERVQKAGLLETWESLSGEELECRLYPPAHRASTQTERPEADWASVHEELKRRDMTLSLVWQEYREQHGGCPQQLVVERHFKSPGSDWRA